MREELKTEKGGTENFMPDDQQQIRAEEVRAYLKRLKRVEVLCEQLEKEMDGPEGMNLLILATAVWALNHKPEHAPFLGFQQGLAEGLKEVMAGVYRGMEPLNRDAVRRN